MFANDVPSVVREARRRRSAERNFKSGRGSNGQRARFRGWTSVGIQTGGQNPFFRMHGKCGGGSPLRRRNRIKLVDSSALSLEEIPRVDHDLLFKRRLISEKDYRRRRPYKLLNLKSKRS